jgi:uncharacterized membrane protein YhaH (DUF805 family)
MMSQIRPRYFAFQGRLPRRPFVKRHLALGALLLAGLVPGGGLILTEHGALRVLGAVLLAGVALPVLAASLALHVRRLHDLGLSGWWMLVYPVAAAVAALLALAALRAGAPPLLRDLLAASFLAITPLLALIRGDRQDNRFGRARV